MVTTQFHLAMGLSHCGRLSNAVIERRVVKPCMCRTKVSEHSRLGTRNWGSRRFDIRLCVVKRNPLPSLQSGMSTVETTTEGAVELAVKYIEEDDLDSLRELIPSVVDVKTRIKEFVLFSNGQFRLGQG